jgi:hypothetical protein
VLAVATAALPAEILFDAHDDHIVGALTLITRASSDMETLEDDKELGCLPDSLLWPHHHSSQTWEAVRKWVAGLNDCADLLRHRGFVTVLPYFGTAAPTQE